MEPESFSDFKLSVPKINPKISDLKFSCFGLSSKDLKSNLKPLLHVGYL